jgi:hypothetical protein
MSLTVREALSLNVLKEARVVAGLSGLDNPIRWTHILDLPNVAEWVKGGEVLLTSGMGIHDDPTAQVKYMREAAEKKVAAVFITTEEYLPRTTPQMREIANQTGIPLVELPRELPFVEVTEAILRRLAVRSSGAQKDYLIDALLAGNLPETSEALAQLRDLGLEPDQHHAVVLARRAGAPLDEPLGHEESREIISALNRAPRRAMMTAKPAAVVAIFPLGTREQSSVPFSRALEESLKAAAATPLRVSVGRLAGRLSEIRMSYRDAEEAMFIAAITGGAKSLWHFNDLGVWRLLLRVESENELHRFVDYYLSPLIDHDREQQTDWLKTLEIFLGQNGNLRATARARDLHRNTVTYQIEHIGKLLGQNLNDAEVRLNLQVALKARELLKARGSL